MSILIKGMEMPERVQLLELHPDGKVFTRKGYLAGEAVEVPTPHGRLIDADELPEIAYEHMDDTAFAGLANALERMPTIIEAEE